MSEVIGKITRDQLRRFLPDHEAVRQFELMLRAVKQTVPADISAAVNAANTALAAANAAQTAANNALNVAQNHTHTASQVTDFNQRIMYLLAWGFP